MIFVRFLTLNPKTYDTFCKYVLETQFYNEARFAHKNSNSKAFFSDQQKLARFARNLWVDG